MEAIFVNRTERGKKRPLPALFVFVVVMAVAALASAPRAKAEDLSAYDTLGIYNELGYAVRDGEATVVGYTGDIAELHIPGELDGHRVTGIGDGAFRDCASLTSVTMPDSVNRIGNFAFSGCSSLRDIVIPDSVASVGAHAFSGTPWFSDLDDDFVILGGVLIKCGLAEAASISIPGGVTSIAGGAFDGCPGVDRVTLPDSVRFIGDWAFRGCSGLQSAYFEGDAPALANHAFDDVAGNFTVYYREHTFFWSDPWHEYPAKLYEDTVSERMSSEYLISLSKK